VGIKCQKKTVLVVPRHLPKSWENFFEKIFFWFFWGCWEVWGDHRGQKKCPKLIILYNTHVDNNGCYRVKLLFINHVCRWYSVFVQGRLLTTLIDKGNTDLQNIINSFFGWSPQKEYSMKTQSKFYCIIGVLISKI